MCLDMVLGYINNDGRITDNPFMGGVAKKIYPHPYFCDEFFVLKSAFYR